MYVQLHLCYTTDICIQHIYTVQYILYMHNLSTEIRKGTCIYKHICIFVCLGMTISHFVMRLSILQVNFCDEFSMWKIMEITE